MKQIFISSIVTGFEEYRSAAKKAVELTHNYPVMCENFGARPYNSETACLTEVHGCDVFILILGQSYGFVPDGSDQSVTHQEYLAAYSDNKPILVFIQNGEKDLGQSAFCREVEDYFQGHFRADFTTPESLKENIIKSIIQLDITMKAEPESSFQKVILQSYELLSRNCAVSQARETFLWVLFWQQPVVRNDIVKIEQNADDIFQSLCKAKLSTFKAGYEDLTDSEYTAFKFDDNLLAYFDNGLILLRLSPQINDSGFDHSYFFVSPRRVHELLLASSTVFNGQSAWLSVKLSGMQQKNFDEFPAQKQNSFSMGNRYGETEKEFRKLFTPFTPAVYQTWVNELIALFKRQFGNK